MKRWEEKWKRCKKSYYACLRKKGFLYIAMLVWIALRCFFRRFFTGLPWLKRHRAVAALCMFVIVSVVLFQASHSLMKTEGNHLTLQVQQKAEEDDEDGVTPNVTEAPKPTESPKSTEAPKATVTPKPTGSPKPTETPKATETPQPTGSLKPTETPKATETSQPTGSLKPTETPEPAETPEPTEMPETTETPKATEKPKATETPEPAETPEPTEMPETTGIPELTEIPKMIKIPEATVTPKVSETPKPEISPSPLPSIKTKIGQEKAEEKSGFSDAENDDIIRVTLPVHADMRMDPFVSDKSSQISSAKYPITNESDFPLDIEIDKVSVDIRQNGGMIEKNCSVNVDIWKHDAIILAIRNLRKGVNVLHYPFYIDREDTAYIQFSGSVDEGTEHLWEDKDLSVKVVFRFSKKDTASEP